IGFLPALLAGLIILVIGYVVARVVASVTRRLLVRVGFDRRLSRLGLFEREAKEGQASGWVASPAFWVIILVTRTQTARAWNMQSVAAGLSSVLRFLPHVLAALLIVLAAVVFGNWVRERILGATTPEPTGERRLAAGAVRAGILAI